MAEADVFKTRDEGERVEPQIPRGAFGRERGIAVGREIQAGIETAVDPGGALNGCRIGEVAPHDAHVPELMLPHECVQPGALMADRDHLPVARRAQQDVVADEPRRAGDEYFQTPTPASSLAACSRYHGIVFEMPASSEIFG